MKATLALTTEEEMGPALLFEAGVDPGTEPTTDELRLDERLVHAAVIRLPEEAFE